MIVMGMLGFIFLRLKSSLGSGTVKVFVLDENVPGLRTGLDGKLVSGLGSEPFLATVRSSYQFSSGKDLEFCFHAARTSPE